MSAASRFPRLADAEGSRGALKWRRRGRALALSLPAAQAVATASNEWRPRGLAATVRRSSFRPHHRRCDLSAFSGGIPVSGRSSRRLGFRSACHRLRHPSGAGGQSCSPDAARFKAWTRKGHTRAHRKIYCKEMQVKRMGKKELAARPPRRIITGIWSPTLICRK
jgi:hypothetical protein